MRARVAFWLIRTAVFLLGCADSQGVDSRESEPEKQPANKPDNTPGSSFNVTPPGGNAGAGAKGGAANNTGNGGTTSAGSTSTAGVNSSNVAGGGSAFGGQMSAGGSGADCPSPTRAVSITGSCVDRVTLFSVGGAPTSVTTGSDGAIWFEDEQRNVLVQIGEDGRILDSVAHTTSPAKRELISGEGDAILWFSDANDRSISKLDLSGNITPFGLGLPVAGLALGFADTVWISVANSAVYRLRFSDPPDAQRIVASPTGRIVMGTDQSLWFSTPSGLGRASEDGSAFDVPLSGGRVNDLCSDPADGIWFSDDQLGRIGRLDSKGWTFYPLPVGSRPHRLLVGPDGAIWFTEPSRPGFFSRLGMNGAVQYFPIPSSNTEPDAITLGQDGNVWFTESALGKVGRLTPDAFGAP